MLSESQIVTLMSNSFAIRWKELRFLERFIALCDNFASEQFVTLTSNSFAARVQKSLFVEIQVYKRFSCIVQQIPC